MGDEQFYERASGGRGEARPRSRHRPAFARSRCRPHRSRRAGGGTSRIRCSSSSAAAPTTRTPTPTSPRSRACCGKGIGFGWAEAAFSGVAHPRVGAALDRAALLGFRRIVVFPYFLFTGVLVKRIYAETDAAAARFPQIAFVKARYLRDHPKVIEAFLDRIDECETGTPAMNCQLCKYRTQHRRVRG